MAREARPLGAPVGAYTEFYWTGRFPGAHELRLAARRGAQREIRLYAEACERFLADRMPITYDAFVANDRTAP